MEKSKVLADAPSALNKPDQPFEVTVDGDKIIARWRWKDGTFFSGDSISNEIKGYTFTVTLKDNGKWKELDKNESSSASASLSGVKLNSSKSIGKSATKSIEFSFGKNNKTGETGIIKSTFDTSLVKKPIREYLTSCGYKKAGLF